MQAFNMASSSLGLRRIASSGRSSNRGAPLLNKKQFQSRQRVVPPLSAAVMADVEDEIDDKGDSNLKMRIQGRRLTVTPAIEEHIQNRVASAVENAQDFVRDIDVTVSTRGGGPDRSGRPGKLQQRAEINVRVNRGAGGLVRAEKAEDNLYAAVDLACDVISRKLRKLKERKGASKLKGTARKSVPRTVVAEVLPENEVFNETLPFYEEAPLPAEVVRTKYFSVPAMSLDDALEQLVLVGHTFFAFRSMENNEINILYHRKHGGFGLIIPSEGVDSVV